MGGSGQKNTRETFNYKWNHYPIDSNGYPVLIDPISRIERYGWSVEQFESWLNGRTAFDAGCGLGWFTDVLASLNPDGMTIGIDIATEAVRRGRESGYDNLLVASMDRLPFPTDSFEYIAVEETIHHTPDPEASLRELVDALAPGGVMTIYVYKEKPLLREHADIVLREQTTEMSIEECMAFAEQMTALGEELYGLDETIIIPDIPLLGIKAGEYSVHEFVYRHFLKCFYSWETEDWNASVGTNFDWYHPEYAYRFSESAFRDLLSGAGLKLEFFDELMSGFVARVKLP